MTKLALVKGGRAEGGKKRPRQSARDWPCCPNCSGRETITASIGNVRNKICVACLLKGQRVVVE